MEERGDDMQLLFNGKQLNLPMPLAKMIKYFNKESGLSATNVQDAIDEIVDIRSKKEWTYIANVNGISSYTHPVGWKEAGYTEILVLQRKTSSDAYIYPTVIDVDMIYKVVDILGATWVNITHGGYMNVNTSGDFIQFRVSKNQVQSSTCTIGSTTYNNNQALYIYGR